ncbi:MAG: M20/M25/M40 family metallo-hydrolase [Hyphomicrobiales bacterium]|nr:M20/M25/M40 family metallo-hydrolase [Hyphomicrobiales bacterium]
MTLPENAFDADAILDGILEWAAVESPCHHLAGVNNMMDLAAGEMEALGAEVERLAGLGGMGDCIVGRLAGSGNSDTPGILVLSHLDTVHEVGTLDERLPIRREGDRAYGPGVLDMKGGARLGIEAMKALQGHARSSKLPVTFMFTPDEEVGSPSSRERIEAEAQKHRYILVPEPLRPWGAIVTGRHAVQRFAVRTHGRPSHAGLTKAQGRSAIAEMARLIVRIEEMNDYDREVTYSVGTVHGGTFVNVVAVDAQAEALCIAPSAALLEEVRTNMQALAGEADGVRIEIEQGLVRPVAEQHPKTMALYEIAKGLAAEIGLELEQCRSGGGSDGNFTGALGIATLDGLGVAGAGAHTFEEHLLISSLVPRCRLLAALLETLDE